MPQTGGGESESETQRRVEDKCRRLPFWEKRNLSLTNVENVVNPPHSPMVRNKRRSGFIRLPRSKIPYSRPIARQPSTLTASVPERERRPGSPLHPAREQKTGDPSDKTTHADKKERPQHKASLFDMER